MLKGQRISFFEKVRVGVVKLAFSYLATFVQLQFYVNVICVSEFCIAYIACPIC